MYGAGGGVHMVLTCDATRDSTIPYPPKPSSPGSEVAALVEYGLTEAVAEMCVTVIANRGSRIDPAFLAAQGNGAMTLPRSRQRTDSSRSGPRTHHVCASGCVVVVVVCGGGVSGGRGCWLGVPF